MKREEIGQERKSSKTNFSLKTLGTFASNSYDNLKLVW